jgi:hypothetical protein
MSRTRAYRRHERAKAIARATARAKIWNFRYTQDPDDYFQWVRLSAITPHPCSRRCCGNPRRWYSGKDGLTMAERRYLEGMTCQY